MKRNNELIVCLICIMLLVVACKPNQLTMAFSPDARTFARGYPTGPLIIYDVPLDFDPIEIQPHETGLSAVAFSPDGSVIATGGSHWPSSAEVPVAEAAVFDAATGEELRRFPIGNQEQGNTVFALAISPRDLLLAVGSEDKVIHIIDTKHGEEVTTLDAGSYGVVMLAFSTDGDLLASYILGKGIMIWDMLSYTAVLTLEEKYIATMAVSPYGNKLAVASSSNGVKIYDMETGKLEQALSEPGDKPDSTVALAFDPIGSLLAVASVDNKIKVWDLATGKPIGSWEHRALRLAFSPNEKFLLFADEQDIKLINLWDD